MPDERISTPGLAHQFPEGLVLNERYTVLDTLNQGSYGIVVLARDSQTRSLVAIKCLTKSQSADSSNDEPCPFYLQELHFHSFLAEYDYPLPGDENIVRCLDAFENSQNAFLVLEYCDLGDLYENIMQSRIPHDTQTLKDMMLQLVDAVQFCHDAGVYHRDIKPENILMSVMDDGSGRPLLKLGDFGLATHEKWSTEIGTGSDRYMAPEQFESIRDGYSPEKADIWALGCCLLNLVFSRNPFKVPSTSDLIFADYVRDPMSLCDVFPTMSSDTFEVLKYALAVDPAKRDLDKVREAICNLVSWTDSETVDECPEKVQTDFTCYADEPITCTVFNREPLRTPSLAQNQQFFSTPSDGTPFSWTSALKRPVNTITKIEESEDEDEEYYSSDAVQSTSVDENRKFETDDGRSSDSGLGTSLGSLSIATPTGVSYQLSSFSRRGGGQSALAYLPTPPKSNQKTISRPIQSVTPHKVPNAITANNTSYSVPITSGRDVLDKYVRESTDKLKFGKSWSDWVEEEEDEEAERLSRGDSRGSTPSSRLSFSETNEDDGDWWEGVPAAHAWED